MKLTREPWTVLAAFAEANACKAQRDLPEDPFLLISCLVPMVNVDLLIKDSQDRTLLTRRDDQIYGAGLHLPDGQTRAGEAGPLLRTHCWQLDSAETRTRSGGAELPKVPYPRGR